MRDAAFGAGLTEVEMLPAKKVFAAGFGAGLRPDPEYTVDAWADEKRILSSVASSEPGPWRTARAPYLREIMRELSPQSRTQRVVLQKGAQTGGSESGFNWIGSIIDVAPGPVMMVQPTVDTAKKVSKQRIEPMIEATPELRGKVKDPRSRDSGNTILVKEFPGGVLIMTGANSAVGLRSMPVRYLFLDEVDGYPLDADEEGDPVTLAVQRTANFPNRKIFECSTPTVKGRSRIEYSFQQSDQRWYNVVCPFCGALQPLKWSGIRWESGKHWQAAYQCAHCAALIPHHKKAWMMRPENGAQWVATATGDGRTAGFHLSALYSPWVTWGEIANEFIHAGKDPKLLKVFFNTKLGETWEDGDGETVDPTTLHARREEYTDCPPGVVVVTAGVDVQDDRLEAEVVGWGVGEESWSLDYVAMYGDPSGPEVWAQLDEYLRRRFVHPLLPRGIGIAAACVDTGGHHTLRAYAFVRGKDARRIWAIKGMPGKRAVWPRRPSKNNKGKVNLWLVGVDSAKETIYARLRRLEAGPGYCHFPLSDAYDEEYFDGLTVEKMRTKYHRGFSVQEWFKPDGKRNEPLDCRVYALAALQGLVSMGLQIAKLANKMSVQASLSGEPARVEEVSAVLPTATPPRSKASKRRRVVRSGYMG